MPPLTLPMTATVLWIMDDAIVSNNVKSMLGVIEQLAPSGEDASRIRMNPGIFAQLRTWALNGLRYTKHTNIKAAREVLGWDTDQLLNLFSCE